MFISYIGQQDIHHKVIGDNHYRIISRLIKVYIGGGVSMEGALVCFIFVQRSREMIQEQQLTKIICSLSPLILYLVGGPTSFEDICLAMQELIDDGKIRSWGLCNDNAYGLTGCTRTAKSLGVTPPCSIQGDFSLIDRKSEENGVAEAASPYNENVGFMSYNALAGGSK